jgi:hypothetical protein
VALYGDYFFGCEYAYLWGFGSCDLEEMQDFLGSGAHEKIFVIIRVALQRWAQMLHGEGIQEMSLLVMIVLICADSRGKLGQSNNENIDYRSVHTLISSDQVI